MLKYSFIAFCSLFFTIKSHAQFTICERCGEQKQGNILTIEGPNKGNWTVKYNLIGHTTTFISGTEKITLKSSDGNKTEEPNGLTTRHTTSEDGLWKAEVVYNKRTFIKAILTKNN